MKSDSAGRTGSREKVKKDLGNALILSLLLSGCVTTGEGLRERGLDSGPSTIHLFSSSVKWV